MSLGTVTSKGQITIPHDVREKHGIIAGTRVEFSERPDGVIEFIPRTGSIMDLVGIIEHSGPPLTIEEMDDAIAEAVLERDLRSRK